MKGDLVKQIILIMITVSALLISIFTVFLPVTVCKDLNYKEWEKTFGKTNIAEKGVMAIQTEDGGYFVLADTFFSVGYGLGSDIWLIKTDPYGNEEWNKTFDRPDDFYMRSGRHIEQTDDGGYIVIFEVQSYGSFWYHIGLIKLDSNGSEEWNTTFSNTEFVVGKQISDGGYLLIGTKSYSPRIFKIDKSGQVEWSKHYSYAGTVTSFVETNDKGYLISLDSPKSKSQLIKIDKNGNEVWNKTFNYENLKVCQRTSKEQYLLLNKELPATGSMFVILPNYYINILKADENGNIIWNKTVAHYDGYDFTLWDRTVDVADLEIAKYEPRFSLQPAIEGGYLFLAKRGSYYPLWIVKVDTDGNEEWHFTLNDIPVKSVQQTFDGGYVLVGKKSDDVWLVKIKGGLKSENQPPDITILAPSDGDTVSGTITIHGTASDPEGSLQLVQIRIVTGSSWITVNGTTSWSYSWNTTSSPQNHPIVIYARSYDGTDYSLIKSVTVSVNQSKVVETGNGEDGSDSISGFELILTICAIALILLWKRKR